jgi:hypothetical protein
MKVRRKGRIIKEKGETEGEWGMEGETNCEQQQAALTQNSIEKRQQHFNGEANVKSRKNTWGKIWPKEGQLEEGGRGKAGTEDNCRQPTAAFIGNRQ